MFWRISDWLWRFFVTDKGYELIAFFALLFLFLAYHALFNNPFMPVE